MVTTTTKIHYKARHIRLSDQTWEKVKTARRKSGLTWNLFMVEYLKSLSKGRHNR